MPSQEFDVLLVGDATMDMIFTGLPRMPLLGEDTVASGFAMVPGETYTNAVSLHRLGLRVAWAADFGNDTISRQILHMAEEEGLNTENFVLHDRPMRRVSVAASFEAERAFLTYYDKKPAIPAPVKALTKVKAHTLFIPGLIYGTFYEAVIKTLKKSGMILVMDGNCPKEYSLANSRIVRILKLVDIFLPNEKEALTLTGKADLPGAGTTLQELAPIVAVKLGRGGSTGFVTPGNGHHVDGIDVKVVDTTGAGDCFDSGFLRAYLDGRPLAECLLWGNISGGLSTEGYGGSSVKVSMATIQQYLSTHCK